MPGFGPPPATAQWLSLNSPPQGDVVIRSRSLHGPGSTPAESSGASGSCTPGTAVGVGTGRGPARRRRGIRRLMLGSPHCGSVLALGQVWNGATTRQASLPGQQLQCRSVRGAARPGDRAGQPSPRVRDGRVLPRLMAAHGWPPGAPGDCPGGRPSRPALPRPELDGVPLSWLWPPYLPALQERPLARGLSSATLHHAHAVLHRALADAVRRGRLARNAAELVRLPDGRLLDGDPQPGRGRPAPGSRPGRPPGGPVPPGRAEDDPVPAAGSPHRPGGGRPPPPPPGTTRGAAGSGAGLARSWPCLRQRRGRPDRGPQPPHPVLPALSSSGPGSRRCGSMTCGTRRPPPSWPRGSTPR